jgi:hypothetical protein
MVYFKDLWLIKVNKSGKSHKGIANLKERNRNYSLKTIDNHEKLHRSGNTNGRLLLYKYGEESRWGRNR